MQLVIAIDLGTTGCRAAAFSAAGRPLASHYLEYAVMHPAPGAAEQEAEGWWSAARACIRAVVGQLDAPQDVAAIGISAQGHSWVPTDADFRPLRPALTWLDTRAAGIARELAQQRGAAFWGQRAGKAPGAWHALCQLLWLRSQEPQTTLAASRYLFAHDFLVAKLTGVAATDFTTAAGSLLLNIHAFDWDRALGFDYEVDVRRFAPVQAAGTVAGSLLRQVAADLGLTAGIPVAVGAQDQKCAALAAGLEDGVATVSLGTSTAVSALASQPGFDETARIPCFPFLQRGTWVMEAPLTTTGAALRWLREFLRGAGCEGADYDRLTELGATSPVGSNGVRFLPFLAGAGAPHWVGEAKGAITGIGLDTTVGDVARAVLEGVALEIAANLAAMRGQGLEISGLRCFGGGARSALWSQIIADATGLPVERSSEVEMAAVGAAILAMKAAGLCGSLAEGQARFRAGGSVCGPHPTPEHDRLAQDYARARKAHFAAGGGGM